MRTWTLVVSVCAHAIAIGAVIVAPIFATTELPEPRRALSIEALIPIDLPSVPPVAPAQRAQPAAATASVPLTEPIELPVEAAPIVSTPVVADVVEPGGTGVPIVEGIVGGGDVTGVITPPPQTSPVRVGGGIRPPTRIWYTAPVYPPLAIASRIEGTVILEALLDEHGVVRDVKVLRSIRLLDDAAILAVSKWRFTPTLLNGAPVPVVMTVTVGFTLTVISANCKGKGEVRSAK